MSSVGRENHFPEIGASPTKMENVQTCLQQHITSQGLPVYTHAPQPTGCLMSSVPERGASHTCSILLSEK
jgi:hypothetical protein